MRKYATIPCFPYYTKPDVDRVELELELVGSVTWEVVDQIITEGEEVDLLPPSNITSLSIQRRPSTLQ